MTKTHHRRQGRLDATVIGEALIDILPTDQSDAVEVPGGRAANTALALGRLGRSVRLVTALGEDGRGRRLRSWLADSGVSLDRSVISRTSTAAATLAADGSARYSFDLEWRLTAETLPATRLVHTGSIAARARRRAGLGTGAAST